MAYQFKKDIPPGDTDEYFESETRENENPTGTDDLTSVYDGETKNFNGFDLYHFLIECGWRRVSGFAQI